MQPRVKQKNKLPHTLLEAGIFHSGFFYTFYFLSDPRFLHIPYQSLKASKDCRKGFKIAFGDNIALEAGLKRHKPAKFHPSVRDCFCKAYRLYLTLIEKYTLQETLAILSLQERPYFRNYRIGKSRSAATDSPRELSLATLSISVR